MDKVRIIVIHKYFFLGGGTDRQTDTIVVHRELHFQKASSHIYLEGRCFGRIAAAITLKRLY